MLVSAIMPTADRAHLVGLAVRSFLAQDWPELELIVVDDGKEPSASAFTGIRRVHYSWQSPTRERIGTKLNRACALAQGDILIRWDDDDWSAPGRVTDQVRRLEGYALSGYHSMGFWDAANNRASKYRGLMNYAMGTSLCFTRQYWTETPFIASSYEEDNNFIRLAQQAGRLISADGSAMMVARIHDSNVTQRIRPLTWPQIEKRDLPARFFEDLAQC